MARKDQETMLEITSCLSHRGTDGNERVSTYRPKRMNDTLKEEIFHVEAAVEYDVLNKVLLSNDGYHCYFYILP